MTELFLQMIEQYGLIAVFVGTALDHTGTPGAMMIAIGVATSGLMDIKAVLLVSVLGGLAGDLLLYGIGYYGGKRALNHFAKKHEGVEAARLKLVNWLEDFGSSVIIWARFVAIIGRYLSLIVGTLGYSPMKFTTLSLIGGIIMVLSFGLPTYYLGSHLNDYFGNEFLTLYLTSIIIVGQIVITAAWLHWKHRKSKKKKENA